MISAYFNSVLIVIILLVLGSQLFPPIHLEFINKKTSENIYVYLRRFSNKYEESFGYLSYYSHGASGLAALSHPATIKRDTRVS